MRAVGIEAEAVRAAQRLAAQLEQDALYGPLWDGVRLLEIGGCLRRHMGILLLFLREACGREQKKGMSAMAHPDSMDSWWN